MQKQALPYAQEWGPMMQYPSCALPQSMLLQTGRYGHGLHMQGFAIDVDLEIACEALALTLGSLTNLSGTNLAGSGKMLGSECPKVGDVAATWPCNEQHHHL